MDSNNIRLSDGNFDYATINAILASRIANAGVPYVTASNGCGLGGAESFWTCITVSLDARCDWANNIFENSRFARFELTVVGNKFSIGLFSGGCKSDFTKKKWRKTSCYTVADAADKISAFCLANA